MRIAERINANAVTSRILKIISAAVIDFRPGQITAGIIFLN